MCNMSDENKYSKNLQCRKSKPDIVRNVGRENKSKMSNQNVILSDQKVIFRMSDRRVKLRTRSLNLNKSGYYFKCLCTFSAEGLEYKIQTFLKNHRSTF